MTPKMCESDRGVRGIADATQRDAWARYLASRSEFISTGNECAHHDALKWFDAYTRAGGDAQRCPYCGDVGCECRIGDDTTYSDATGGMQLLSVSTEERDYVRIGLYWDFQDEEMRLSAAQVKTLLGQLSAWLNAHVIAESHTLTS